MTESLPSLSICKSLWSFCFSVVHIVVIIIQTYFVASVLWSSFKLLFCDSIDKVIKNNNTTVCSAFRCFKRTSEFNLCTMSIEWSHVHPKPMSTVCFQPLSFVVGPFPSNNDINGGKRRRKRKQKTKGLVWIMSLFSYEWCEFSLLNIYYRLSLSLSNPPHNAGAR